MLKTKEQFKQNRQSAMPDCYHCGSPCFTAEIKCDDHHFCCDGCKLVYELLNEKGLCSYYDLQEHPGLTKIKSVRKEKFAYLDTQDIVTKLITFTDGTHTTVTLYLPSIHCSSCLWLLEHLGEINPGITASRVNFTAKEVTIHYLNKAITLRTIAELLTSIGYEPYISLDDENKKRSSHINKQRLYKLGIAGFCFGNIMMMSFPEYLSGELGIERQYTNLFRYLNLLLALPVFFYCATEFFNTAWKGLKQRILNIDAPIALAIIITFSRSLYEISFNTGAGYLDSMSGIVFFMLAGRLLQERTYQSISFNRDYKSYFPIAVSVKTEEGQKAVSLHDLKKDDVIQIHHEEIIPADSVLLSERALIDYAFVTGESEPVQLKKGEVAFAGGKLAGNISEFRVVKPVAGSYLTELWNQKAFEENKEQNNDKASIIHRLSNYFTIVLFSLAGITGIYWSLHDPSQIINSVSAMLIVACPCALLLSATFTNGNILTLLSRNGLYVRDSTVVEQLGYVNHISFDKTGTLTETGSEFTVNGHLPTAEECDLIYSLASASRHPNSRALTAYLGKRLKCNIANLREIPGAGIEGDINGQHIKIGSAEFTGWQLPAEAATLYVSIEGKLTAYHNLPRLRNGVPQMLSQLRRSFDLSLISGDNDKHRATMADAFSKNARLLFSKKPLDKLNYIKELQQQGKKVLMIGDGLNDAGALRQSNVGITLADDINNFTPSCDAILDARQMEQLPQLLLLAKSCQKLIALSFIISILYNFIGLYFAINGLLKPVTAAILMPCSTLSIVLISTFVSKLVASYLGLKSESPVVS